jgi:hypothetical protein
MIGFGFTRSGTISKIPTDLSDMKPIEISIISCKFNFVAYVNFIARTLDNDFERHKRVTHFASMFYIIEYDFFTS